MTDQVVPPGSTSEAEQGGGPETGSGYVFGETFAVRPVVFSIENGQAVFEGDIILGTVAEMAARTASVEAHPPHELGAVAISPGKARWPDGVIPFELDAALPEAQQAAAVNAVAHWTMHTRLALVPRDASNAAQYPDYLIYSPGSGCSSAVGRQGGAQTTSLGSGCFFGQAVHETGHVVGLWHEQSREDRDQFVTIVWANIDPAQVHNFDQHITDGDDIGPYDYGSIMHYPATAFSTNGQATIVPKQAGVVIGQRTALSPLDRAAVRVMYPDLEPSASNTWVGDFTGDGQDDVLYYLRSRRTWYLGSWATGGLVWTQVGDTSGFGQVGDGRPFWVGDFDGDGRAELLFYSPADGNWWLGDVTGAQLAWTMVGSTLTQFGDLSDGRPVLVGRFSGDDGTELLLHSPSDDVWWLGSWSGTALAWTNVGTSGDSGLTVGKTDLFWAGDFGDDGQDSVLRYSAADTSWWEGMQQDGKFEWWQVGTFALGSATVHPGRFSTTERVQLLFRADDTKWWLGTLGDDDLTWANVGTSDSAGAPLIADLTGDGRDDVTYVAPDGSWHVGVLTGDTLTWTAATSTAAFGDASDGRSIWVGTFGRKTPAQVFSYVSGDGNCWLGSFADTALTWTLAATFEA